MSRAPGPSRRRCRTTVTWSPGSITCAPSNDRADQTSPPIRTRPPCPSTRVTRPWPCRRRSASVPRAACVGTPRSSLRAQRRAQPEQQEHGGEREDQRRCPSRSPRTSDAPAATSAPPPSISSTNSPDATSAATSTSPAHEPDRARSCPDPARTRSAACTWHRRRRRSRSRSAVPPRRSTASPGPGSCAPRPAPAGPRRPARPSPAPRTRRSSSRSRAAPRPRPDADDGRLHRLPHVDVRVAGDQHVRPGATACAARVSLVPATRWSTSTPSRRCGAGAELGDGGGEVVHAVHRLDDHALDPQVVAPHRLDQRGVVDALDPDPARPGRARGEVRDLHRSRRRDHRPGGRRRRDGPAWRAGRRQERRRRAAGTPGGGRAGPRASPRGCRPAPPPRRTRWPGPRRRCPRSAGTSGISRLRTTRVPSAPNAPR